MHHRVLWLVPDKHEDISVGRQRVASHLRDRGMEVTARAVTPRNLIRTLRELDEFDIIIGTTRAGALLGLMCKLVGKIPLVVDHIDPISQFEKTNPVLGPFVKSAEHGAFSVADHVLYVYPEEEDRVRKCASAYTKTELGVEVDLFRNTDADADTFIRSHNELAGIDSKLLVYIGGLEPMYNIEELLDTIPQLNGWMLVVAGAGSKESLVRAQARERDDVVFLETLPHDEIASLLSVADVGISLVDDPYTLKVLEYLAAGLPVVQVEGESEERFGDVLTYCELCPESISQAVNEAAKGDRVLAVTDFVEEYSWDSIAETYEAVIRSCVS